MNSNSADFWLHLDHTDSNARRKLEQTGLEPDAIAALLDPETRPRRAHFGNGDVIILRSVNQSPGAEVEDMISLRIWLTRERIITVVLRNLQLVTEARQRIADGMGESSAPDLFLWLANTISERLRETVRSAEVELEDAEDKMLETYDASLANVFREQLRQAVALRRYAEPQLQALKDLQDNPPDWINKPRRLRLREIVNNHQRSLETLIATREHISAALDQLNTMIADRMQRTSQALTIVATIFLPLNLIGALFGTNVGGIPYGGDPMGFWLLTGGFTLAFAILLVVAYTYRNRWL
ncbi:MAG: hypothetical protein H6851_00505 [Geminicoccaceae bacterium]|nr:hypothetical protein [Geminicoccaceae bacterium]MCB9942090.1 hypothetical protein [Geminicoccaceae bacterium]